LYLCTTGAGISTSSGIPDFRSSGGLYDSLRPELLTATSQQKQALSSDPTLVVSKVLFSYNQFPYLEVRRPFIIGSYEKKWKATLAHYFIKVLDDKGILTRLYTQNIDGLDYQVGISSDKIIPVHGSINEASCEFCQVSKLTLGNTYILHLLTSLLLLAHSSSLPTTHRKSPFIYMFNSLS